MSYKTIQEKKDNLERLSFKRNSEGYFEGSNGEKIQFNGIRDIKPAYVKFDLTKQHIEEIVKCSDSLEYFVDNYCQILTPKGYTFADIRSYQWRLLKDLKAHKRNILLQPRQSAKSVTSALYILWCVLFNKEAYWGIAANQQKMATEILTKIKQIFIRLPVWLQQGVEVWNAGSIAFENGSKILTSATSGDSFRGYTFSSPGSGIFCDEVAFIKPNTWEEFFDSVFPTVSSSVESQIILASTPNGLNHFYNFVEDAKQKRSEFNLFTIEWDEVPGRDEEWLQQQIATFGPVYVAQNYQCSFIGSTETLISANKLKQLTHSEVEFENSFGFSGLQVYMLPEKQKKYIITVDPALDGADNHGINVFDVTSFPYSQDAVFNDKENYLTLPKKLAALGAAYNDALIIIENNIGSGQSIADMLFGTYEYGNLYYDAKKKHPGHRTTERTRRQNLELLKTFIENDKLLIRDKKTINELYRFSLIKGKYQAEDGYHDDLVISCAILFAPFANLQNFEDYDKFVENVFGSENDEEETKNFVSFYAFDGGDEIESDELLRRQKEMWGVALTNGATLVDVSGFS